MRDDEALRREKGRLRAVLSAGAALAAFGGVASAQPAEAERDEIVVTGRARELYRVPETTSGKLPTAPLDSSLSIAVINEELIRDQGARDAQDLYRNISGVSFFSYAGVTARGFRQEEIFYDGLRGDPTSGFSVPQLFNVERVEFLKGPAGMLYGPGAPGGVFNYITKTPEDEFSARATAIAGTEARYGGSAEVTGPIATNLSGRLGVFYETRNTPRRGANSEVLVADVGLAADLGFGRLILQGTRYDQNLAANRLRGVPADDDGNFLADRRWNHNEPTDFLDLDASVGQARFEAEPIAGLALNVAARYTDNIESQQYHEPFGLFDSDGDGAVDMSRRQYRDQIRDGDSWSVGANAVWSATLGPIENRLLAGADWYKQNLVFDGRAVSGLTTAAPGLPTPLSLLAPAYGVTDPANYALPAFSRTVSSQKRQGAYILEEATVGRFIATVGARVDQFDDVSGATSFEDEATTLRAGLVWRARDDVSLYAQWAESYEPQGISSQDPRAGGPFEPTEGEIIEGGVKTELFGGRIQSSLAAYRIVRTNILQTNPLGDVDGDGIDDLVAFGEVTSKGVEFDVTADITEDWVLVASYGYNDARITETNGLTNISNSVGDRFANAPENQAGFWTRYQFPEIGLAFALGGDYVGERLSLDGQRVRPYTVFDASVIYDFGSWRALLRVDNLFDKTYAASGFSERTGHFPGEPQSIFLELSREW